MDTQIINGMTTHHEKCITIKCVILKWIWNVIRKWTEDKRNERVLEQTNNQTLTIRQEWRRVHTTFEGASTRSEINVCSYNIKIHTLFNIFLLAFSSFSIFNKIMFVKVIGIKPISYLPIILLDYIIHIP
jgi:hypothetical protein